MWLTANRNCSPWTTFCNHNLILFPNIRFRICRLKSKILIQRSFYAVFWKCITICPWTWTILTNSSKWKNWILLDTKFLLKPAELVVQCTGWIGRCKGKHCFACGYMISFEIEKSQVSNPSQIIAFCILVLLSSSWLEFSHWDYGIHNFVL